jgi:RNA polymerase sigma factor (TIGR02999 family)
VAIKTMSETSTSEVTQLLLAWGNGDKAALDRLMPLLYDELRRLAASYLRRERDGHTLETSALAHEAYMRLVDQNLVQWRNRAHFFGIAAQMMRRILVDHARSHRYAKRGGGARRVSLDEAPQLGVQRAPDLVALDDALQALAQVDPEKARIVELRFFGGLTTEEVAEVMGVSTATVTRHWRLARAWLYRALSNGAPGAATENASAD